MPDTQDRPLCPRASEIIQTSQSRPACSASPFLPVETTRKALVKVYPPLCLLMEPSASPGGLVRPSMARPLLLASVSVADLTSSTAIASCAVAPTVEKNLRFRAPGAAGRVGFEVSTLDLARFISRPTEGA